VKHLWLYLALIVIGAVRLGAQSTVLTNSTVLTGTTKMGAINLSHSITSYYGSPSANGSQVDSGNGQIITFIPFVTPASGTVSTGSQIGVFWYNAVASTNWGLALYSGTTSGCTGGYSNCANVELCGATSTATTVALTWNLLTPAGCPATLSNNTTYYLAIYTDSNSQQFGVIGGIGGTCPYANTTDQSTSGTYAVGALWPTKPALGSADSGCHAVYMGLTYASTQTYDLVNIFASNCQTASSNCITYFPAISSNHRLHVFTTTGASGNTLSSLTDSASDTFAANGTCSAITGVNGTFQNCMSSTTAYATNGVTTVTSTFSIASEHISQIVLDVAGEASSSSNDRNAYDAAFQGTPFTSAATATTAQAKELWLGFVLNFDTFASLPVGTFSFTGSWNNIYQGPYGGTGAIYAVGIADQITSSTGACSLTGSYSLSGTYNLSGCSTFR